MMDKQREAFEAWAKRECCTKTKARINFSRIVYEDGFEAYEDPEVEVVWAAWQAAQQAQWLPIESAPDDASFVLVGRWHMGNWCCEVAQQYQGKWIGFAKPTHWMPLPPEPKR